MGVSTVLHARFRRAACAQEQQWSACAAQQRASRRQTSLPPLAFNCVTIFVFFGFALLPASVAR